MAPLLIAWLGGPRAALPADRTDADSIGQSIESPAHGLRITPKTVEGELESRHPHNWHADPFARGAYSYVRVGGLEAPRRLGAPVADTLFFAGEATVSDGHTGTVHGAMATGNRVADEIIRSR